MRGTILGFDASADEGVINTGEGRVKFTRAAWKGPGEPLPGRQVDYDVADGMAVDIYAISGRAAPADPAANQAMTSGIISLVCAVATFMLGPFGILTLVPAIIFGIKGKNEGRDLEDKTAYYLSIAGLWVSGLALAIVLLLTAFCVGVVGMLGVTAPQAWN